MYRYARLKHDFQLEEYGFHKRKNWLPITPETVPFNNKPAEGKGPALRLPGRWFEYVRRLNTDKGFAVATDPKTGWVNEGWGNHETPLVQSLSMAGNVVILREVSDEYGRLLSLRGDNPPPDPGSFNFFAAPQYVHKFSCIGDNDKIRNPRNGVDSYYPLLGAGDLWVPMRRLELFPGIPCKIQTVASVFLRSSPKKAYTNVVGGLLRGQLLTLRGYAARGTHVWGFVTTEAGKTGFVALLWYPNAESLQYLTTWQMETVPTLPPK